jgi:threonyl-tRNA synthetase
MRELLIHADKVAYESLRATKVAEKDVNEADKNRSLENVLWVRIAVEKDDERNPDEVVKKAVADIKDVMGQIKASHILLYPYAHLLFGSAPASSGFAIEILKKMEADLRDSGFSVYRAPFGFYKRFDVVCKGHPLSELSRDIKAMAQAVKEDTVSAALKAEDVLKSYWYILDLEGNLREITKEGDGITGFDFSKLPNLEKFAKYEIAKVRVAKQEPPHIKLMRSLELADYESGSDPGNMRFYPKGRLVKSLLEQWVTQNVIEYGGMEIEAPIMYDFEHPSLKKYLDRFPARQYTIQTPEKKVFLRFAACFGQFLMAHDMTLSYRNLPVKLYEMTRYSFRLEKHGELTGLRRLRAFTMPDCHALCEDIEQAKIEMLRRFDLARKIQRGIGFDTPRDLEMAVRVTKEFWESNQDHVINLANKWGKPVLVEMWDQRFFYYTLKYEWNFVDAQEKAAALTTDQIDVENGERYDINFVDKDGKMKHPIILHLSPSGAIERVIYALLEKAHLDQQAGKPPMLPLWLSPVQARLVPVSKDYVEYAKALMPQLKDVRVDIDDRDETLSKKIRDAEMEWVPAIIVIGKKEKEDGKIAVRFREDGTQKIMKVEEFMKWFSSKTAGMPFKPLSIPAELSKRPIFVG